MDRRSFIRSLGGAIAASMLPFQKPLPNPRLFGVKAMLDECDRFIHCTGNLDLAMYCEAVYAIARKRQSTKPDMIEIYVSKQFVDSFFFGKPIA